MYLKLNLSKLFKRDLNNEHYAKYVIYLGKLYQTQLTKQSKIV